MSATYANNDGKRVLDFQCGDENFTGRSFMSIPLSIWQTMTALIFGGVLERFPRLKSGAAWAPSWLAHMDAGFKAFQWREARLQNRAMRPSDYAKRPFRLTPFSRELTGWILNNGDRDMVLFSSDFSHVEGGRNPLNERYDYLESLDTSGTSTGEKFKGMGLNGMGISGTSTGGQRKGLDVSGTVRSLDEKLRELEPCQELLVLH